MVQVTSRVLELMKHICDVSVRVIVGILQNSAGASLFINMVVFEIIVKMLIAENKSSKTFNRYEIYDIHFILRCNCSNVETVRRPSLSRAS